MLGGRGLRLVALGRAVNAASFGRNFSANYRNNSKAVEKASSAGQVSTATTAQKAKENVKTASYGLVIVAGVGVTGVVLFTVVRELFSSSTPTAMFQTASEQCMSDPRVQDLLGEPIHAFGEETRRGRRRHVSSLEYRDDQGLRGTRVQFYLQGKRKRATAQLDAREDSTGKMRTRFLIVTADDLLGTTIVIEDNRNK